MFHLANGLWTMGITWGVWTSPAAQRRALGVCTVFGLLLAVVGVGALFGMRAAVNTEEKLTGVERREARMIRMRIEAGDLAPNKHKMSHPPEPQGTPASAQR